MAKFRYTGRGAVVSAVSTSGTTFTIGLCRNVQEPPRVKAAIDVTGMEDTSVVQVQGIEQPGNFTFTALHDPIDAADIWLDAVYASGKSATWRVTVNNGTKYSGRTFEGYVIGIEPQGFGGNDPVTRQITVARTGSVSYTTS